MADRNTRSNLIIDVGAHNGDDTAYYLHLGYRVIAIEANPELTEDIKRRFPTEVEAGTLTVLNVGVAHRPCILPFCVSDDKTVLSSFDRALVETHSKNIRVVPVECTTLDTVIRSYGVPYYVKIDIEGYDHVAVDGLTHETRPQYVSCELTHTEGLIPKLYALGYRRFKLVNQSTYTDATPVFDNEIGFRAMRKACGFAPVLKRLVPNGVRVDFDKSVVCSSYAFPQGSSGPFAEGTFGRWWSREDAERRYERIRERYVTAGVPLEQCWFDVHAS